MIRPTTPGLSRESGSVALPLPSGDPDLLLRAAQQVARAGVAAEQTATVRGALAPLLAEVWIGPAATQATAEARVLAERSRRVVSALPAAERVIRRYAAVLADARTTTRRLQSLWDQARDDYDRDRHHLLTVQATTGADQGPGLVRLAERHRAEQSRLAQRHTSCRESLASAARDAQAALLALSEATLPARGPAGSVRAALTGDLDFATGAARAAAARRAGLDAALAWRQVTASGEVTPSDADELARRLDDVAADPLVAQAFLDEVGIETVERTLSVISSPRGSTPIETSRALAAVLGAVIISATAPDGRGEDPRTARQLASRAALLQDEAVRSVGAVVTTGDGEHDSGYWLLGQLLVGARQAGRSTALPSGFARRLVGATAAAEVARSRDPRFVGRHGTTRAANGEHEFASLFDAGDQTGDALHVLLAEARVAGGREAAELLSTPVDSPLGNSRGDGLVLAEYLVRRWVTHTVTTPQAPTRFALATNADLGRLLALVGDDVEGAAVRSRVMIEIGRTSEVAQRDWATVLRYQSNTASLEPTAVAWVGQMRESTMVTLHGLPFERPPVAGVADGYAVETGERIQPLLANRELARLVGAFALGADFRTGPRDPDTPYQRLMAEELARLSTEMRAGLDTHDTLLRLGFYHGSGSAALMSVAERQDELNLQMWQHLATVKNLALGKDRVGSAVALVIEGSDRTAWDDVAIAELRSEEAIHQAEADEARLDELLAMIVRLDGGAGRAQIDLTAVTRGGYLAPATASAAHLREERRQEIRAALEAAVDDRVQQHIEDVRDGSGNGE